VAMSMGKALPPEALEAFYIDESGAAMSLSEAEGMTQAGMERLIDYRAVKYVIENGGSMRF
jgi:hypothetical protein